ncbi:hypothetical protein ACFXI0_10095 [Kitasatospora indigofera]|uniref:hypothetical protein n=1 Tax=Kitasatospora indigofera TaxID=67307 RepID=UPI0036A53530
MRPARSALCQGGFHDLCYDQHVPRPTADRRFPADAHCYCPCGHPEPTRDWARIRATQAELRTEQDRYDTELARREPVDRATPAERTETTVAHLPAGRRSGPPAPHTLDDGTELTNLAAKFSSQLQADSWILHDGRPHQVTDLRTRQGGGHILRLADGQLLRVGLLDTINVFQRVQTPARAAS